MTAIPARVAGVDEIILCTPAQKDGKVPPLMLYAAQVAGADRVFTVGGAQAMAALAFGTQTVPAVDKIVGPANVYGTSPKNCCGAWWISICWRGRARSASWPTSRRNPAFAALDLLTQAEHDAESAAFLITPSETLAQAVHAEIERQLAACPAATFCTKSLEDNSAILDHRIAAAGV